MKEQNDIQQKEPANSNSEKSELMQAFESQLRIYSTGEIALLEAILQKD
jgi:hypothetical protein